MSVRPAAHRGPGAAYRKTTRHLVVVLGDQLDAASSALDGFEPATDSLWMAEVADESEHVWSSKPRTALFLSAMRHFAEDLRKRGWPLDYVHLDDEGNRGTLGAELEAAIARRRPTRLIVTQPGDWRVWRTLESVAARAGVPLEVRDDRHFYVTAAQFAGHASGRKQLRMEHFYRELRRSARVLMDGDAPAGGQWNYDQENRAGFGRDGPGEVPAPAAVGARRDHPRRAGAGRSPRFAHHPGRLDRFGWPVTRADALAALADFIEQRLPRFGLFQDAMWAGEPWLYHSRLLGGPQSQAARSARGRRGGRNGLSCRACAAGEALRGSSGRCSGGGSTCAGSTGRTCPGYLEMNALGRARAAARLLLDGRHDDGVPARRHRPDAGVRVRAPHPAAHGHGPVRLPARRRAERASTNGISPCTSTPSSGWNCPTRWACAQHADGGLMASKPYVATGKYIQRMSNYCAAAAIDPAARTGRRCLPVHHAVLGLPGAASRRGSGRTLG
ncbi:MAG: cryptochrome/photolyase family protein [Comamonadaceae bacterium]|nr:cryptochrome/photolyase family protein [Comamonadaceae bacterium]